jgi:hypothetical protein
MHRVPHVTSSCGLWVLGGDDVRGLGPRVEWWCETALVGLKRSSTSLEKHAWRSASADCSEGLLNDAEASGYRREWVLTMSMAGRSEERGCA